MTAMRKLIGNAILPALLALQLFETCNAGTGRNTKNTKNKGIHRTARGSNRGRFRPRDAKYNHLTPEEYENMLRDKHYRNKKRAHADPPHSGTPPSDGNAERWKSATDRQNKKEPSWCHGITKTLFLCGTMLSLLMNAGGLRQPERVQAVEPAEVLPPIQSAIPLASNSAAVANIPEITSTGTCPATGDTEANGASKHQATYEVPKPAPGCSPEAMRQNTENIIKAQNSVNEGKRTNDQAYREALREITRELDDCANEKAEVDASAGNVTTKDGQLDDANDNVESGCDHDTIYGLYNDIQTVRRLVKKGKIKPGDDVTKTLEQMIESLKGCGHPEPDENFGINGDCRGNTLRYYHYLSQKFPYSNERMEWAKERLEQCREIIADLLSNAPMSGSSD